MYRWDRNLQRKHLNQACRAFHGAGNGKRVHVVWDKQDGGYKQIEKEVSHRGHWCSVTLQNLY